MAYTRQQLADMEDAQIAKSGAYDATGAVNRFAQGAWGSISAALDQKLQSLQGQAVGAGRLQTGFYDQDQGTLVRGALNDFSNQVAQQSVNAAGLDLRGQEDYADELTGRRQEVENDYRQEEQRKRARARGIGGAIGGVLGGVAGSVLPGVGTQIGATLGSSLGGSIAGG